MIDGLRLVAVAACCMVAGRVAAQTPAQAHGPVGVWRGTSTCTVHPSACHDEVVVYRITPSGGSDSLSFDGRRVVNGQEQEMGVLGCQSDASGAHVTCAIPNGTWRFTIRGDSLVGDLRLPSNVKFRDVRTVRSR